MTSLALAIRAATETLARYGVEADRCDILQNGSTLVLRLTETVVARVVQDTEGPRQGTAWFARENAIAQHLSQHGAPVVALHPDVPPGPHEHLGYPMNFWQFVTRIEKEASASEIGTTLCACHRLLRTAPVALPALGILTECSDVLESALFPPATRDMLRRLLSVSIEALKRLPHQALHGDAHLGNLMNTTRGPLWSDWEDAFAGPVEWDLASAIWNTQIFEKNELKAGEILAAYRDAGGRIDEGALSQCLVARAVAVTAWYPILYPAPEAERRHKLQQRLEWLEEKDRGL
jgi:hypothetical protein